MISMHTIAIPIECWSQLNALSAVIQHHRLQERAKIVPVESVEGQTGVSDDLYLVRVSSCAKKIALASKEESQ